MDKLRREILSITKQKPEIGLEYYNELLDIIDAHHDKKPDTSVETCKAIIEGISKLILHKIDRIQIQILDKWGFDKLIKRAIDSLQKSTNNINEGLLSQLLKVFQFINIDRNDHCDIGHGRASVKEQINCSDYSLMVSGLTESVAVYLLKKLDESLVAEDVYESEQMQDFNQWLDDSVAEFPIETEKYSKLLYQHDKERYYERYRNEFFEEQDDENEPIIYPPRRENSNSVTVNEAEARYAQATNKQFHKISEIYFDASEKKLISEFATQHDLKKTELTEVLKDVALRQKLPTRDEYIRMLNFQPKLHERKAISERVEEKVIELIDQLRIRE